MSATCCKVDKQKIFIFYIFFETNQSSCCRLRENMTCIFTKLLMTSLLMVVPSNGVTIDDCMEVIFYVFFVFLFVLMWTSHSGKSSFLITIYDLYFLYQQCLYTLLWKIGKAGNILKSKKLITYYLPVFYLLRIKQYPVNTTYNTSNGYF